MSDTLLTYDRFRRLVAALQQPASLHPAILVVYQQVMAAWQEAHRHYHTSQHLGECLALFDMPEIQAVLQHPPEVEMALWLHDLIYDTMANDNEACSADAARRLLSSIPSIENTVIERIAHMILSTKDHLAHSPDAQILIDIDLAILGSSPERFAEYEQQIRAEYAWVEESAYVIARQAALAHFAERPQIFQSPVLSMRLEAPARLNLAVVKQAPLG